MNKSKKTIKRAGAPAKRTKTKRGRRIINQIRFGKRAALIVYERDELHEAIDKAIEKAYRRKGDRHVADPDEIKKNVKEVLETFSNRKRGRHFDKDVTKARDIFLEELENAGMTLTKYRRRPEKEKADFWDNRIWAKRQDEIIEDASLFKPQDLKKERSRIRDRVRRALRSNKGEQRINYRPK